MKPPENALILAVDEKPSIQALERSKMPKGRALTGRLPTPFEWTVSEVHQKRLMPSFRGSMISGTSTPYSARRKVVTRVKLTIRAQLTLYTIGFVVLVVGVSAIEMLSLKSVNLVLQEIDHKWLPTTAILGELNSRISAYRIAEGYRALAQDSKKREEAELLANEVSRDVEDLWNKYATRVDSQSPTEELASFLAAWKAYQVEHNTWIKADADGTLDGPAEYSGALSRLFETTDVAINRLVDANATIVHRKAEASNLHVERSSLIAIAASATAMLLAMWLLFLVRDKVSRPLGAITAALTKLAAGSREIQMPELNCADEIGELAKTFEIFRATALELEKARLAEQLTSVAASLPGVICSFRHSAEGKQSMPYASVNFFKVYGLAPEDVRADAEPLFQRVNPEDLSHLRAGIAESARTLTLWRDEFRYEHPQKGIIWLEGLSSPNLEPGGDIVWHGYIQDVTERKRANLEQQANETRLRALFDSGLLGIMCWSVDGAITDANDKFLEMLGYRREDLSAGRLNWVNMTPPEYRSIVDAAFAELKETGVNQSPFEKEYFCKDGTRLPVLVAGVMVDREHLSGVAFVLDISERKGAEVQMRKSYADRMNLMKSMTAGLAHEINQPLAATAIYLTTLRKLIHMEPDRRPTSAAESLDKATAQVTRAGQILNGLRAFIARGEPDKIQLKLHDLIHNVLDVTGVEIRQILMTLQLNSEDDEVLADKVQIEQVLVTLIRNAKDAIGASECREIVIWTSSNGIDVSVKVSDTGVGLPEKDKSSLFEPFVTTKVDGMGVGLSISRAIIEAHRGRMWAELNPKGGAIFGFTLPLACHEQEFEEV